jgi:6-phosphogluconate dehydrogenase (decarboxylating)
MFTKLQRDRHRVVVYDRSADLIKEAESVGCVGASSFADLIGRLKAPRTVWIIVPSGAPTDETIQAVTVLLHPGDTVIDDGNTRFHDDVRRVADLKKKQHHYVDAGTSGGIWVIENRLLADGRWRRGTGQTACADLHHAGAPNRLGSRRRSRGRALSKKWCITASNTA